ncbi:MAG: amidohydrolase, partial [Pseudohongiella sp.]|nr:amidohydrolase [Pseudohongiella sp.]
MNFKHPGNARFVRMLAACSLAAFAACSQQEQTEPAAVVVEQAAIVQPAGVESFTAMISGNRVGQMEVQHGDVTNVGYEYRDNGRGPSVEEVIEFNDEGVPRSWRVAGATTFGNVIEEQFEIQGSRAFWTDTTGSSESDMAEANLYVAQES